MRAIRKFHTPEKISSIPLPADNLQVLSDQWMGWVCDTNLGGKIIIRIGSLQRSTDMTMGPLRTHA